MKALVEWLAMACASAPAILGFLLGSVVWMMVNPPDDWYVAVVSEAAFLLTQIILHYELAQERQRARDLEAITAMVKELVKVNPDADNRTMPCEPTPPKESSC